MRGTRRRKWGGGQERNTGDLAGIGRSTIKHGKMKCNSGYISVRNWLLLHYTLPANPSARRVYIWRKLKRVDAILLNESVWILPDTPRTAEQFQWLAVEIQEMDGQAYVWRSNSFFEAQDDSLVDQFI